MTRHITANTSIEGKKLNLRCRIFYFKKPTICSIHNCMLYNFKMKLNAEAIIYVSHNPLNYKFDPNSVLNQNDSIVGRNISGYSTQIVPSYEVRQHSGRHRAQFTRTNDDSLARIIQEFQ